MGNTESKTTYLKEKYWYIQMPQDERRKQYRHCFRKLEDIPTWLQFYKDEIKECEKNPKRRPSITVDERVDEKVAIFHGDITELEVDAIVNSATKSLWVRGQVDKAISQKAGPHYAAEYKEHFRKCEAGQAVITGGYELPAKYVIHTVPPSFPNSDLLKQCYKSSLELAKKECLKSIAFPCIAIKKKNAFDPEEATRIALRTIRKWLDKNHEDIDVIVLCIYEISMLRVYNSFMQEYFPVATQGLNRGAFAERPRPQPESSAFVPVWSVDTDHVMIEAPIPYVQTSPQAQSSNRDSGKNKKTEKYLILREKVKYADMDPEYKRQFYLTPNRGHVSMDRIKTWPLYHENLQRSYKISTKCDVHKELNNRVSLWHGDITELEVDAIVNSAAPKDEGGEVNALVLQRSGNTYLDELSHEGFPIPGQANIVGGYRLPAKYVINTVAPKTADVSILERCYRSCLETAIKNGIDTIAFPCLATRKKRGFDKEAGAHIALNTVRLWMNDKYKMISRVIFCVYTFEDKEHYEKLMHRYFPVE